LTSRRVKRLLSSCAQMKGSHLRKALSTKLRIKDQ
jgi:hypothetical protein